MNDPPLIDDFRPSALLRPGSAADLGEIVRRAASEGAGLYPIGGATMLHLGNPPTKPGYAVDLRRLDRVIDFPARDMTITVQAGITIAKLQEILAAEGQRLPVDVPQPERATLGGSIAVNASGPRRFGFGTLRDYVIGISFTDDSGREVKAGGRVVKNVAGYDLCKLQIGALGTLGIVTQVTLKLKPVTEESQIVKTMCSAEELPELLERVHASKTRPTCVEVRSGSRRTLLVGFEENVEAVAWQVEQLRGELVRRHRAGDCGRSADRLGDLGEESEVLVGEAAAAEWQRMTNWLLDLSIHVSFKANLLPASLPHFLAALPNVQGLYWQAHAANGIVVGHWGGLTLAEFTQALSELRHSAAAGQGSVVVTRCPPAWKRELKVWGWPRDDWALMRKVKQALDPRDLFNPGRFLV